MATESFLLPDWPAPDNVKALSTTRVGGCSESPYASFNLGDHVGDDEQRVLANRQYLNKRLGAEVSCQWLQQVHGIEVIEVSRAGAVIEADGAVTGQDNLACIVMTADCLPVLFCDRAGTRVAAAHAGWRGLASGVLEATVDELQCSPEDLLCWLGPAIGASAFEVGPEVREQFCKQHADSVEAFRVSASGKWLADLYLLAAVRLKSIGVEAIYGGNFCTYNDPQRFFSYRRDGVTGRMASLIWLQGR
ncbi:MAG: peptidoglycan editing factor PgeF [Motiliproteus sp.]